MDMDVLDDHLQQLCSAAMAQAKAAVEAAPDGAWIAGSEWQVREVFQQLARDSYEAILGIGFDAIPARPSRLFPRRRA